MMGIPRRKRLTLLAVLVALTVLVLALTSTTLGAKLLGAIGLLRFSHSTQTIVVSGDIEVTDAEVSFKIPGLVEKRLFDEGQWAGTLPISRELSGA